MNIDAQKFNYYFHNKHTISDEMVIKEPNSKQNILESYLFQQYDLHYKKYKLNQAINNNIIILFTASAKLMSDQQEKRQKQIIKGRPKINKDTKNRRRRRKSEKPQQQVVQKIQSEKKPIPQIQRELIDNIIGQYLNFYEKINLQKGFCFTQKTRVKLIKEKKCPNINWKSQEEGRFKPDRQKKSIQNHIIESKLQFKNDNERLSFEKILLDTCCIFDCQAVEQFFVIMCQLWKISQQSQQNIKKNIEELIANIKENEKEFPFFSLKFTELFKFDFTHYEQALTALLQNLKQILDEIKEFYD